MVILKLGLLFACVILLKNNLHFCAAISTDENKTVDTSKASINSNILWPEIEKFPIISFHEKLSVSFSASNNHQFKNGLRGVVEKSKQNDFEKLKSNVLKSIYKIDHSKSVSEMLKLLQQFPTNIFDKHIHQQLHRKLGNDFNNVVEKGASVINMAIGLERRGANKNKKQIADFTAELKEFEKQITKFTNKFNSESKKQRNKSLQTLRNSENLDLLSSAKININFMDLFSNIIEGLKMIPHHLRCLILRDCENDNHGNDNNADHNHDADNNNNNDDTTHNTDNSHTDSNHNGDENGDNNNGTGNGDSETNHTNGGDNNNNEGPDQNGGDDANDGTGNNEDNQNSEGNEES